MPTSLSSFSLQSISLETIVVLIFIAVLVVGSFRYGKTLLVSYILALYPAYLILLNLPYAKTPTGMVNLIFVLLVFFAVFFGLRHVISSHFTFGAMRYVQSILLSIVATALTLVMYSNLAKAGITISPFLLSTAHYVSNLAPMFVIWLALPIVALFLLGRE